MSTTELPLPLVTLSGDEASKVLLVKFYFTNKGLIPRGIWLKQPISKAARNILRKESGMEKGEEILKDLPDTSVSELPQKLAEHGFLFIDVYYTQEERRKQKPKIVLTIVFERNSHKAPVSLSPETVTALGAITAATWEFAHMWWNENGVDVVILTGRRPEKNPIHAIVARDGVLQAEGVA